ncbi:hypothetical protein JB92DRAFT_2854429 [Gautieria morchelliformis]|nr:hypothetical protein JB92DRAFT_2854429 [Gautieria morchelliformis]
MQARYPRFLLTAFLGVVLAFPLGILTAAITAFSLFGTILPISILLAVVFPIVVPLIAVAGVLLASWCLVVFAVHTLIRVARIAVAFTVLSPETIHILSHAHEIAYMGIYGVFVILNVNPLPVPEKASPLSSPLRQTPAPLFIRDCPKLSIPVFPPTPPYSDPSYTPSRSPTSTESRDTPVSLRTPVDESPHTSLAQLSDLLGTLKDEELSIVASYVEILQRGRSAATLQF